MDLDGLGVDVQTFVLVGEEVLHSIALITLELNDVACLLVVHDGSIASKLLLDDLENFLEVELGRDPFDCGQSLTTITLLDTNMDIRLLSGLVSSIYCILILGIREGIKRPKVLNGIRSCGHTSSLAVRDLSDKCLGCAKVDLSEKLGMDDVCCCGRVESC